MLNPGAEHFELFAVFFVAGVVASDFGPKSSGVIHVIEVSELVDNDVIA